MRKIQKRISLEPMTSRLPSVLPAYMNNQLYFFDDTNLKKRDYTYTSNYGMIPVDVGIPSNIRSKICDYNGDGCYVISFERLSTWYHKFTEYYHLLNDYSHCDTVYSSATAYYDNEVKRWPEDLYFGTDRQTYIDLDDEIKCMGGVPTTSSTTVTTNCNGSTIPKTYQTTDNGFYKWICNNIIPTYTLSKQYQDYWQRQTLYYPDVIKWIGWFDERYGRYGANPDCKAQVDCCDCTEYVNRGGKTEKDKMESWYQTIQSNIQSLNSKINDCYSPTVIMPIELQNSIEDLGEFTIFCEEYKAGVDYRTIPTESAETKTIIHFESGNTHSGTTVLKDGVPQQLVSGMGYTYDDKYMEILPDDDGWKIPNTNTVTSNLTALTSSKVQSLHVDNYLVDDIGNPIEGLYNPTDKNNHQPPEGSILQPIYQVGHKYNMVRNEEVDNQFIGDEIDSMKFYYMCLDGTTTTPKTAEKDDALGAIERASIPDDDKPYYEDIFCDIVYHIGNIYELNDDNELEKITDGDGVKYTDTVQFVKTRTEYYLKKKPKDYTPDEYNIPSAHTVSYPIYVYKLKRGEEEIIDNTYDTPYTDSLSEVSYTINRKYDESNSQFPVMREEYRIGIASPESVKGDIYIDRGINAAFEKHLKLGEVTSLESLLQYGNRYFKIMEN